MEGGLGLTVLYESLSFDGGFNAYSGRRVLHDGSSLRLGAGRATGCLQSSTSFRDTFFVITSYGTTMAIDADAIHARKLPILLEFSGQSDCGGGNLSGSRQGSTGSVVSPTFSVSPSCSVCK